MRSYDNYKESSIEWLGKIPTDWQLTSLKFAFSVVLGKMLQPEKKSETDKKFPYLRAANIQSNGIDYSDIKKMWFTKSEQSRLTLLSGDLLISEGGDVGRPAIWENEREMYFQNSINRVRPLGENSNRYLYYWIIALKEKGYIDVLCNKSTIAHFTAEKVAAVPVPLPSSIEQQKIAQFLDYETAKIDALIGEQKRLIELLKEKRQAVISHAVTKGLNPDAPMKDSGVEWLGEVPEHWIAGKVKYLAKVISKGTTPSTLGGDFEDKGVRFIKAENVGKSISVSTSPEFYISKEVDKLLARSRLQESDVLVIIAGATTGKASVITSELLPANTNQAVSFIRPISSVYSKWIALSMGLSSTQNEIQLTSVQSAQPNLSMEDLGNLSILIPPKSEVSSIIQYLESATKKIDILKAESERLMMLQEERRSALISAAVTGKIDVRDWQPPTGSDTVDSNASMQKERHYG